MSKDSWKDELWTIVFVLILAANFVPSLQDTMAQGFANLETSPLWGQWGIYASIAALVWQTNNEGTYQMKDNFDKCFDIIPKHEGRFVNHPEDPSGATNLGVTKGLRQEFIGRAVSMGEMKAQTPDDVEPVYKKMYADKERLDDLLSVLDWAVNSGTGRAAKVLQKEVGAKAGWCDWSKNLASCYEPWPR